MPERRHVMPPKANAIRALRLDAWRPVAGAGAEVLLGSLHDLLRDFAPRPRPALAIPTQRGTPESLPWRR